MTIRRHWIAVTTDELSEVEISCQYTAGGDPAGFHGALSDPQTATTPRISCSRGPDGVFSNDRGGECARGVGLGSAGAFALNNMPLALHCLQINSHVGKRIHLPRLNTLCAPKLRIPFPTEFRRFMNMTME